MLTFYDFAEAQFKSPLELEVSPATGEKDPNSGTIYSGSVLNYAKNEEDGKYYWTLGNGSGVTITGTLDKNDNPIHLGGKSILPYIKGVIQGEASDLPDSKGVNTPLPGTLFISYDTATIRWLNSDRVWQSI